MTHGRDLSWCTAPASAQGLCGVAFFAFYPAHDEAEGRPAISSTRWASSLISSTSNGERSSARVHDGEISNTTLFASGDRYFLSLLPSIFRLPPPPHPTHPFAHPRLTYRPHCTFPTTGIDLATLYRRHPTPWRTIWRLNNPAYFHFALRAQTTPCVSPTLLLLKLPFRVSFFFHFCSLSFISKTPVFSRTRRRLHSCPIDKSSVSFFLLLFRICVCALLVALLLLVFVTVSPTCPQPLLPLTDPPDPVPASYTQSQTQTHSFFVVVVSCVFFFFAPLLSKLVTERHIALPPSPHATRTNVHSLEGTTQAP